MSFYKPSLNKKAANPGNPIYREARVVFSPDGNMKLEYGKERNRHNEIQSYKDSCDVNNIVRRYENGDQTALLRNNTGVYCDISQMPQNIHEAVKLSKSVDNLYNSLGSDVKQLYPDVMSFTEAFSDVAHFDGFLKNAANVVKARNSKVKKEVNSDAE